MKTPDSSGWSQRTQRGIASSTSAGFEMRNDDPGGSIDSPVAKPSRSATAPGRPAQRPQQRAELVLDDPPRQVLVGQPLAVRPPRIGGRLELGQDVVVEEVGERPVPDVMEEPGHPQRLDDEPLGRDRLVRPSASAVRRLG